MGSIKTRAGLKYKEGSTFREDMLRFKLSLLSQTVLIDDLPLQRLALAVDLLYPGETLLWDGFDDKMKEMIVTELQLWGKHYEEGVSTETKNAHPGLDQKINEFFSEFIVMQRAEPLPVRPEFFFGYEGTNPDWTGFASSLSGNVTIEGSLLVILPTHFSMTISVPGTVRAWNSPAGTYPATSYSVAPGGPPSH